MAEAGFYFVGTESDPDLARCYWCRRELGGWEPTDDPWSEHARRPCPFIEARQAAKDSALTMQQMCKLEQERAAHLMVKIDAVSRYKVPNYGRFTFHVTAFQIYD